MRSQRNVVWRCARCLGCLCPAATPCRYRQVAIYFCRRKTSRVKHPNKLGTEPSPSSFTHKSATPIPCQDVNAQSLQKVLHFCALKGAVALIWCINAAHLLVGVWREEIPRKLGFARRRGLSGEMVTGTTSVRNRLQSPPIISISKSSSFPNRSKAPAYQ